MRENLKKAVSSPLFLPVVAAPVLFGLGVLLLRIGDGRGAWYYILYFLTHTLSAALFFYGAHRVFSACPSRRMPRALTAAFPILISLSVYHFAIAFFDAYAVQYEDGAAAFLYALLSLFTDSVIAEWLLLLLSTLAAYLFFLRGEDADARTPSAWLLTATLYFAYLLVGRVSEYLSYKSAHLGIANEKTTVSFLLFAGFDLLLSAFGYLVLFLSGRAARKKEAKNR
ncbi:MAG: hypothetical protein J6Z04_07735 [Clostridia bacterium]|nr:hypothetical protein [Clostridia bacterium]